MTRRRWLVAIVWVVAIAAAHLADPWVWAHLRDARINDKDWGRLFRSFGYLPFWLLAAGALYLHDRGALASARIDDPAGTPRLVGGAAASDARPPAWRRGVLLALLPALAGAAAEIGKLVVRRLRPSPDVFAYDFRGYGDDLFSSRNLGIPSSHVAVAVGGALALALLFPAARRGWYLIAAGCALVRVLALGHFASDTVAAAAVAWVVAIPLAAWYERAAHAQR